MGVKRNSERYFLGLDIGIASVGWALLSGKRIIDLGVRCFDKAETADKGESLNLARRMARLMRHRLQHRKARLSRLATLLKQEGLIARKSVLRKPPRKGSPAPRLWQLRVEALERCLAPEEWARVIYHICKHRGFHWQSKAEEAAQEKDKEGGRVKQGLAATTRLMMEKGYRTAAEMVVNEFPDAQRNKRGDYSKALSRTLLAEELALLFQRQRELGNPHAHDQLEHMILGNGDKKSGLLWEQRPPLSGEKLLKMLGRCTFERDEYRAPKASFTAERHVLLTRVNNLRLNEDGCTRPLNDEERRVALSLPYQRKSDISYDQLRTAWKKAGLIGDGFTFSGLRYPPPSEEKAKNPESAKFVQLRGWHDIRKALEGAGLQAEWREMADAALSGDPEQLDGIARVLSVYKEDDEARPKLQELNLPGGDAVTEALLTVRFDKFSNLSLKALRRILPHMERGLRYDEACRAAGYHHSMVHNDNQEKKKYLPPFYVVKKGKLTLNTDMDLPRNPVVLRALNQARKVVNAIVREYGPPMEVHIEMARDLSRPLDERRRIEHEQQNYQDRNEKDRERFIEHFGREPKGLEFPKWQLYREQQGKCAYSFDSIDLNRLLEPGYVEIDHALPYSRSFDDSKNNKVLCFARENRNKGNQTPYEYLDGANDSERWRAFVAFVQSNKAWRPAKKNRLLRKDFGEESAREFRERNLNDTRYICRFFKNYVEQYLSLHESSKAKRCTVVSGGLTSLLRARWGLRKLRGDSDRHHALDAAVVAACGHWQVQQMNTYVARQGWVFNEESNSYVNTFTGECLSSREFTELDEVRKLLPLPWPHFRQELETRLYENDPEELRERLRALGAYDDAALDVARPLFVSRAPQRRNSGAAHKETIYGQSRRLKEKSAVTQRVPLTSLKLSDVDKLVDPERNQRLYDALRAWLGGKPERESKIKEIKAEAKAGKRELTTDEISKIAALEALPRKPGKSGRSSGPVVRTVTMVVDKMSGIPVRGGIAKNDTMLRVDVFTKSGRFFLVPVYVHHRVTGVPNHAIVAHKNESEWIEMDKSYTFLFSLHPNDFVRVTLKKEIWLGYYSGCDRASGTIALWAHDRAKSIGKGGLIRGIGVKTALKLEKFHVDVLGRVYPAKAEPRRGLA